jgi:hypothetical protein
MQNNKRYNIKYINNKEFCITFITVYLLLHPPPCMYVYICIRAEQITAQLLSRLSNAHVIPL